MMATRAVLAVRIVARNGVGSMVTWAPEVSGCAVAKCGDRTAVMSVLMNVMHRDVSGMGHRAGPGTRPAQWPDPPDHSAPASRPSYRQTARTHNGT
jgi:hypothetical protein